MLLIVITIGQCQLPQFNSYINQKYVDADGNPNTSGVHHYEIDKLLVILQVTIEVPSKLEQMQVHQ